MSTILPQTSESVPVAILADLVTALPACWQGETADGAAYVFHVPAPVGRRLIGAAVLLRKAQEAGQARPQRQTEVQS